MGGGALSTSAENVTFMVIRGAVALAIVGLGFYCIGQGIHFFRLPHAEAEQIHIHLLGLDITANGLGAVVFGTGLALCFVGKQTAPKRVQAMRTTEILAAQPASTQPPATESAPSVGGSFRTTEGVILTEGVNREPGRLD